MEDRWLSVDEIAMHLGIKRDTVYRWTDRVGTPAHRMGRLWKFKKDEVDEWGSKAEQIKQNILVINEAPRQ